MSENWIWLSIVLCLFASCTYENYNNSKTSIRKEEIQLQLKQEETKRLELLRGCK